MLFRSAPECQHCYAESNIGVVLTGVCWGTENQGGTRKVKRSWNEPLMYNRRAMLTHDRIRCFTASLSDVFDDWNGVMLDADGNICLTAAFPWDGLVPWKGGLICSSDELAGILREGWFRTTTMQDCRLRFFREIVDQTPLVDHLVLTKCPERIAACLPVPGRAGVAAETSMAECFRPNLWLGTSAGTKHSLEKFLPPLIAARDACAVTFLSCEPLLEDVSLKPWLPYLDWVIIGGESGDKARPSCIEWIRDVLWQCLEAGVPVFVKQLGARPLLGGKPYPITTKKGGYVIEWPRDLDVRQFPVPRTAPVTSA